MEETSEKIVFDAYDPFIKQTRSDKGWRVELSVSQDQYDLIKDLPSFDGYLLKITIEPYQN